MQFDAAALAKATKDYSRRNLLGRGQSVQSVQRQYGWEFRCCHKSSNTGMVV